MDTHNRDIEEFKRLVADAVAEGLRLLEEKQPKPYEYFNWPTLSFHKNGLPSLSEGFGFSGPPDYKNVFTGYKPALPVSEIASFQKLLAYVEAKEWLLRRLFPAEEVNKNDEITRRLLEFQVFRIPLEIIDRYIHLNNTMEFSTDKFETIYEPLIRPLVFEGNLWIDICVPILFVKFTFERVDLDENTSIERMDDKFHLARFSRKSYGPSVHPLVLSAATHCLVLRNWYVKTGDYWRLVQVLSEVQAFPLKTIDDFFAALRLATGVYTGYAQVLARPIGWALHYKGDLPSIEGTSVKAYPTWFENYYWLDSDIPELSEVIMPEVGHLFSKLAEAEENSLRIAVERLNLCYLREKEEDYILDATIGLEALLSDDNRQEMTYKLAMRLAALAKLPNTTEKPPSQIFREVKKVYDYRSAVVHGSAKTEKKREIVLSDNSRIPAGSLAIEYLRMAIRALLEHPEYRKPQNIDKYLLLDESR